MKTKLYPSQILMGLQALTLLLSVVLEGDAYYFFTGASVAFGVSSLITVFFEDKEG